MYVGWILLFLKKRHDLDYKNFSQVSQEKSKIIELINGMQEIKLHNAEKQKRWSWEYLQARLFAISIAGLKLEQYQSVGSGFINELKNILITILSAKLVIDGEITLGMIYQLMPFDNELVIVELNREETQDLYAFESFCVFSTPPEGRQNVRKRQVL